MWKKINWLSLFFIVVMSISSIAYAEVKIQKPGYTITLPDGWIEIPRYIIKESEKMLSLLAPDAPKEHYDCGFQLDTKDNWFEYPYILIQVKELGRVPESKLKKLRNISSQKTVGDLNKKLEPLMSNIQFEDMNYDDENKIIWMRHDANVHNIGPVIGISGMILTEKGFIQVNAYSLKKDYPAYESVFYSIVTSVIPEAELAYKPRLSDALPSGRSGADWGKVSGKVIVGLIVGALGAIIAGIRKKKNNQ